MQLLNTVHTVAKTNNTLCINKSSTPLTMFTTLTTRVYVPWKISKLQDA